MGMGGGRGHSRQPNVPVHRPTITPPPAPPRKQGGETTSPIGQEPRQERSTSVGGAREVERRFAQVTETPPFAPCAPRPACGAACYVSRL
jgi:hypothetical protein